MPTGSQSWGAELRPLQAGNVLSWVLRKLAQKSILSAETFCELIHSGGVLPGRELGGREKRFPCQQMCLCTRTKCTDLEYISCLPRDLEASEGWSQSGPFKLKDSYRASLARMSQLGRDMLNISKRTEIRFYFTDWQLSMSFAGKSPATSLLALLIWKPQFLRWSPRKIEGFSKWTHFSVGLSPCWSPARTRVNSTWVQLCIQGLAGWHLSWGERSKPGWEDQDSSTAPWLPPWHRLSVGVFSTRNLVPRELLSNKNVPILPVTIAYKPARSSPK